MKLREYFLCTKIGNIIKNYIINILICVLKMNKGLTGLE